MEKDLNHSPRPISKADQTRSKIAVVVLLVAALAGVGVWSYLEFSADVMVDRKKGKKFAARFEKECQASYTPSVCEEIAGMNHSSCFRGSIRKAGDGIRYDVDSYLACMREAQAEWR